jgi:hypothetical protein
VGPVWKLTWNGKGWFACADKDMNLVERPALLNAGGDSQQPVFDTNARCTGCNGRCAVDNILACCLLVDV